MWFATLPNREPMTLAEVLSKPAHQWLPYVRHHFTDDGTPAVQLIDRGPRVEKVIKETTRKNAQKAAGPVARVINAWAIKLFAKLSKPEKMIWIFDYRIDWDAKVISPAGAGSSPRQ
jgi:hypothetical protein